MAKHPTERQLREAQREFVRLLDAKTHEDEWQSFFSSCPWVLSRGLPLRLRPSDIVPRGRPGKSEPDFVFFPSSSRSVDNYGVIEIKRPSSKIVTKVREDVAILSRDARTAAAQTIKYSQSLPSRNIDERRSIFLGNDLHLFVIMGLADELEKLSPSLLRLVEEQLPRNLRLYPYDVLLHEFELSLPRKIMALATTTERARTRVDMRVSSDTAEKLNHVSGLTGISKSALVGTALRMADPRNDRTLGKELAGGTRQLSVRLPRQTADSLRKLSKETGVPQREIVRHAMRLLLETPAMTSLINAVENAEQMLDQ